jgi:hypothetical protein
MALEYPIWRFQVNQDGFKLNFAYQRLVYVDYNTAFEKLHIITKNL